MNADSLIARAQRRYALTRVVRASWGGTFERVGTNTRVAVGIRSGSGEPFYAAQRRNSATKPADGATVHAPERARSQDIGAQGARQCAGDSERWSA